MKCDFLPQKPVKIAFNPLRYWNDDVVQTKHYNVRRAAMRILSRSASSVSCERLFSILGFTIDSLSSRLRPDRANARICLKAWILGEQIDAEVLAPKASPTETVTVNI